MSKDRKNQLSKLMQDAWLLVKNYGLTMKEAMVKAWAILKLKKQMLKGIVKFFYTKVDGSTRMAWGTLKADLLPEQEEGRQQRKSNNSVLCYYDTDKQAFRCFKLVNLIGVA